MFWIQTRYPIVIIFGFSDLNPIRSEYRLSLDLEVRIEIEYSEFHLHFINKKLVLVHTHTYIYIDRGVQKEQLFGIVQYSCHFLDFVEGERRQDCLEFKQ